MKTYRILPFLLLVTAFQPQDYNPYPKCGMDNDCYYQRPMDPEIERQEEEIDDSENDKLEELKRNAEQPGLNKKGPEGPSRKTN